MKMRRGGSDIEGNAAKKPLRNLRSSNFVEATTEYERTHLHLALLRKRDYRGHYKEYRNNRKILGWPSLLYLEYGGRETLVLHNDTDSNHPVNVQQVKKLIRTGADVNAVDTKDNSCLHYAVENEDCCKLIELLIDAGAKLESVNTLGDTPLLTAVKVNNLNAVDTLIKQGANVNASNKFGETCLHLATDDAMICMILNSGGSTQINCTTLCGCSPIFMAIAHCQVNTLIKMIQAGADVNFKHNKCSIETCPRSLRTPLREAVEKNRDQLVEVLLKNGANPNEICDENISILWHASRFGYYPPGPWESLKKLPSHEEDEKFSNIVQFLITHGANVCTDVVAFGAVINHGSVRAIKLFLDEFRRKKVQIPFQKSLLHSAIHNRRDDVFNFFLASNFHGLDQADEQGYTAFHRAVQSSNRKRAEILLEVGADINTVSNTGNTVLDTAFSLGYGYLQFVLFLLSYGSLPSWRIDMTNLRLNPLYQSVSSPWAGETIKELMKCIALNESVGHRIDPASMKRLMQSCLTQYREAYKSCENEIQLLRSSSIHGSITLYDILTKVDYRFAKNENLAKELDSEELLRRFPIYATLIRERFAQSQKVLDRLMESGKSLSRIFGLDYSTFHQIYENILRRLSPIDHMNLRQV